MLTLVAQNSKPTYAFGTDKGEPIASLYRKSVPITRYTEQAPFAYGHPSPWTSYLSAGAAKQFTFSHTQINVLLDVLHAIRGRVFLSDVPCLVAVSGSLQPGPSSRTSLHSSLHKNGVHV